MEPQETFLSTRERPTRVPLTDQLPRRVAYLHLRPSLNDEERRRAQAHHRVSWDANVRDFPNQRVSKSCCVFHKKKLFGESSSSSSSSSDHSSNSDCDSVDEYAGSRGESPLKNNEAEDEEARKKKEEGERAAMDKFGLSNSGDVGKNDYVDVHHHHDPAEEGCGRARSGKKRHHPKCTKEHCYCGTRFH